MALPFIRIINDLLWVSSLPPKEQMKSTLSYSLPHPLPLYLEMPLAAEGRQGVDFMRAGEVISNLPRETGLLASRPARLDCHYLATLLWSHSLEEALQVVSWLQG